MDAELAASLASTLDHMAVMTERIARLEALVLASQEQVSHRVAIARRAGEIDDAELYALYERYREASAGRPKFSEPWSKELGGFPRSPKLRDLPNMPDGSWRGSMPVLMQPRPPRGVSVVYVLYDEANEPCYVGSTLDFKARIKAHVKAGKRFASWAAWPCRDREHAYQREEQMLRDVMPYLNRKAAR